MEFLEILFAILVFVAIAKAAQKDNRAKRKQNGPQPMRNIQSQNMQRQNAQIQERQRRAELQLQERQRLAESQLKSRQQQAENASIVESARQNNQRFQQDTTLAEIEKIKLENPYDILEMSGSRAVWKEVLAVYAVKTTTDPINGQDVATITDEKKEILREIFWEMNEISFRTEEITEIVIVESDDGNGNVVETETTETRTYLFITVSHKTADEMAEEYNFDRKQKEQLDVLLSEENDELWLWFCMELQDRATI